MRHCKRDKLPKNDIGFEHFLITAQLLGFEVYIPPFATARGEEILKGVNYASGAAGIRNESGKTQVICIYIYIYICATMACMASRKKN